MAERKRIVILCVYRPPHSDVRDFIKQFEVVLSKISSDRRVIVCGDLNINYLRDSRAKQMLLSLLHSFNLNVAIELPTRIASSSTCIDYVIASIPRTEFEA